MAPGTVRTLCRECGAQVFITPENSRVVDEDNLTNILGSGVSSVKALARETADEVRFLAQYKELELKYDNLEEKYEELEEHYNILFTKLRQQIEQILENFPKRNLEDQ